MLISESGGVRVIIFVIITVYALTLLFIPTLWYLGSFICLISLFSFTSSAPSGMLWVFFFFFWCLCVWFSHLSHVSAYWLIPALSRYFFLFFTTHFLGERGHHKGQKHIPCLLSAVWLVTTRIKLSIRNFPARSFVMERWLCGWVLPGDRWLREPIRLQEASISVCCLLNKLGKAAM